MDIIALDWDTLTIIIVALFALSGFLRGWWREGITTIFLILLTIFLTSPELAGSIIEFINGIIETAWGILTGLFETLGIAETTVAAASTPPIVINPDDRTVFVIILIIMVLLSYFTSKITLGGRTITFGGRIFGGILGAIHRRALLPGDRALSPDGGTRPTIHSHYQRATRKRVYRYISIACHRPGSYCPGSNPCQPADIQGRQARSLGL